MKHIKGEPGIGIQIAGAAEQLKSLGDHRQVVEQYAERFKRDADWTEEFISGQTDHKLYKLTPASIDLFDEVNFPGGQRHKVL